MILSIFIGTKIQLILGIAFIFQVEKSYYILKMNIFNLTLRQLKYF